MQSGTLLNKEPATNSSPGKLSPPPAKKQKDLNKIKKGRRSAVVEHLVENSGINNIILQHDKKTN
jgi:hypothetical protein